LVRFGMEKSWIELRVEVDDSLTEPVVDYLVEEGSPGVIQEEIRGKRQRILAYFPNDPSGKFRGARLRSYFRSLCRRSHSLCSVQSRVIRDQRWAESWKVNFRPVRVTPHLVIHPPWEPYSPKPGEWTIEIDPGMAFGTGSHPSTRICLKLLEEILPSFKGKAAVLDVGTGSGILAIAAHKLGARRVVAIDIDPVAVENARKNASANRVKDGIDLRVAPPGRLRGHFNVITANLLPQELLPLSSILPSRLGEQGLLIASGFLSRQQKEIVAAFQRQGMEAIDSGRTGGWAGVVMRRKR
jgi:ribosomal protein L11 methyltransferase